MIVVSEEYLEKKLMDMAIVLEDKFKKKYGIGDGLNEMANGLIHPPRKETPYNHHSYLPKAVVDGILRRVKLKTGGTLIAPTYITTFEIVEASAHNVNYRPANSINYDLKHRLNKLGVDSNLVSHYSLQGWFELYQLQPALDYYGLKIEGIKREGDIQFDRSFDCFFIKWDMSEISDKRERREAFSKENN